MVKDVGASHFAFGVSATSFPGFSQGVVLQ